MPLKATASVRCPRACRALCQYAGALACQLIRGQVSPVIAG